MSFQADKIRSLARVERDCIEQRNGTGKLRLSITVLGLASGRKARVRK